MTFNFDNSKKIFLTKKDKSNKGSIDKKILRLCNKINNNKNYFTTSSCSGRILLIIDDKKKNPNLILFRMHEKINLRLLKKEIKKIIENNKFKKEMVYFKQEPCFLVVSCRDKNSQWQLFSLARNRGWKKSGILSINKKFLVELMSTENISFPIIKDNKLIVNENFLRIVIKKSNNNLVKVWQKIKMLENLLTKNQKIHFQISQ